MLMITTIIIKLGVALTLFLALSTALSLVDSATATYVGFVPGYQPAGFLEKLLVLYEAIAKPLQYVGYFWFAYGALTLSMLAKNYSKNRSAAGQPTSFTAGYSALIWIIPLVNLVRPYQALNEMY
jgi:hypothetical protein